MSILAPNGCVTILLVSLALPWAPSRTAVSNYYQHKVCGGQPLFLFIIYFMFNLNSLPASQPPSLPLLYFLILIFLGLWASSFCGPTKLVSYSSQLQKPGPEFNFKLPLDFESTSSNHVVSKLTAKSQRKNKDTE